MNWGPCDSCKWWQIEPKAKPERATVGHCIEERLIPFQLSVTGNSGCDRWMKGSPARAEGSSEQPPHVAPVR